MIRILIFIFILIVVAVFIIMVILNNYYKKCPAGSLLVIFNNNPDKFGMKINIIKSGGAFVWPMSGAYKLIDLKPFSLDICPDNLLSNKKSLFQLKSKFLIAITSDENVLYQSVDRIAGLSHEQIQQFAFDLISGHLRNLFHNLDDSEIATRNNLEKKINETLYEPLNNLCLQLINLDIIELKQVKSQFN